ncbi:unnamed protein product [Ilex paraguariensis]|uniref:C2H2-type domain-containing protein n=1 Tax=Ilex paraguariensis TaxID=185542 RepID=A0ABC8QZK3_9AQUA
MVDAARQKALFRAKLNASKKEKRIEDPLVRYNENDQPVCRVCDFVLKSDSHWPAHQASRKHNEAINTYRANAAALNRANNVKQLEPSTELPKPKAERPIYSQNNKTENSTGLAKPRPSSVLPSDFFNNREVKRQKNGTTSALLGDPEPHTKSQGFAQSQVMELFNSENKTNGLSSVNVMEPKSDEILPAMEKTQTSNMIVGSESKHIKGALPEGFFDDKDSDLRARGITPIKPDVKTCVYNSLKVLLINSW